MCVPRYHHKDFPTGIAALLYVDLVHGIVMMHIPWPYGIKKNMLGDHMSAFLCIIPLAQCFGLLLCLTLSYSKRMWVLDIKLSTTAKQVCLQSLYAARPSPALGEPLWLLNRKGKKS